jgi:hypothetical protein
VVPELQKRKKAAAHKKFVKVKMALDKTKLN